MVRLDWIYMRPFFVVYGVALSAKKVKKSINEGLAMPSDTSVDRWLHMDESLRNPSSRCDEIHDPCTLP